MIRNILLILLVSGSCTGLAFSQGSTGHGFRDPNYVVTRTVSEAIVSIDLKNRQIVCTDYDGKPHTVKINDQTKFPSAQAAAALNELKEGQRIRLVYRLVDSVALEILPLESPRPRQKQ